MSSQALRRAECHAHVQLKRVLRVRWSTVKQVGRGVQELPKLFLPGGIEITSTVREMSYDGLLCTGFKENEVDFGAGLEAPAYAACAYHDLTTARSEDIILMFGARADPCTALGFGGKLELGDATGLPRTGVSEETFRAVPRLSVDDAAQFAGNPSSFFTIQRRTGKC